MIRARATEVREMPLRFVFFTEFNIVFNEFRVDRPRHGASRLAWLFWHTTC